MDASIFQYGSEFRRSQLQGILSDCILVYSNITSSGKDLENNENKIRDEIAEYLSDDDYKENYTSTVKYFQVDTEVREKNNGRTDIRFLQVLPYKGQKVYFTIECKRLDGNAFLSSEYVTNGINRFTITMKYGTPLGYNAIMGFIVRTLSVEDTCNTINTNLSMNEYLVKVHEEITKGCYKFESKHILDETITLFHLWLDFSSCMKKKKK